MPLATVTITDAQMKALGSTAVTLIAAPGAGLRIVVFGVAATCNIVTNGGTSVVGTVRFDVANQLVAQFTMVLGGNDGAREAYSNGTAFSTMDNPLTNRAIEIDGSVNAGATFASTDGFHIALLYDVMDDPN